MSVQLLDRTRKINKLLHNSSSSKVVFNDICQVLMETLSSNILVLSKKGKVLGDPEKQNHHSFITSKIHRLRKEAGL